MKLFTDHVEWGEYVNKVTGNRECQYYLWFKPNWLPPGSRYIGPHYMWYDGPHGSFGFWFFNISWSTKWTKADH